MEADSCGPNEPCIRWGSSFSRRTGQFYGVSYGGPQVPTFVQRPGTPPQPHHTTLVRCHRAKCSVMWLWCLIVVWSHQCTVYYFFFRGAIRRCGLFTNYSGHLLTRSCDTVRYDTIRYDTTCYFNVRSKADISQLNLPHGTDN